jgi:DNA-binding response OmpR family regulator
MLENLRADSSWQFAGHVLRAQVLAQEHVGMRWLNEARAAILGAFPRESLRLTEVEHGPDIVLVAGSAEWAGPFVRQFRGAGDSTPIVVLNASATASSSACILDEGADDCLICPFDPLELRARIQAVLRRLSPALLRTPSIAIDRTTLRIRVRTAQAQVSRRQFDLFVYLAEHRERWVHSNEIIAAVSGTHHDPGSSILRVQIHALRKALGAERDCIRCDGHKSYMLTLTISDSACPLLRLSQFAVLLPALLPPSDKAYSISPV